MAADLLIALSLRFFLFEFKLFKPLREWLNKYPLAAKFLSCSFCQGFWCGAAIHLLHHGPLPILRLGEFALASAFLSFLYTLLTFRALADFEKMYAEEK